uniref:C-type lectin domain-containing protein n=1 Tax=Mastacembelus armatus TaxID=205130 RepID=A0A7N8Y2U2_9TELE
SNLRDQGEVGEEGDQGKLGKSGPPGLPGIYKNNNYHCCLNHEIYMYLFCIGDKGDTGLDGPSGLKGKPGSTCDCGRYRKVVGQLDVNTVKLRNAVKFVKNVILGLKETEERYYLLVKEPKKFREASVNCKLRGGTLAMPKTSNTNQLMADYVSQAGLTRVYIGVQAQNTDKVSGLHKNICVALRLSPTTNSSCVELLSTGTWAHVECDATMFFICEFPKIKRRGGNPVILTPENTTFVIFRV